MSIILKDNKLWSSEFKTDQMKKIGNTVKPLLAPWGAYLVQAYFRGEGGRG